MTHHTCVARYGATRTQANNHAAVFKIHHSPTPSHHGQRAAGTPLRPVPRRPYLSHLDGLRTLAVSAVLLYHADVSWMPGGFLGVDLFFVLSGYLITALLVAEWQAEGGIDLMRFWLRRARRLLRAPVIPNSLRAMGASDAHRCAPVCQRDRRCRQCARSALITLL